MLVIAPSVSELEFLRSVGVGEVVTADIRPEAKPDRVVDVCHMPQVPDASFDAVLGSYVLTCVHDLDAALSEFARVLRSGGVLYTSDPLAQGKMTEEYTDIERISAWYGREAYEKYRVGSFRCLGALDAKARIEPYLAVQDVTGTDIATGTAVTWHIAVKTAGGARPDPWQDRVALCGSEGESSSSPTNLVQLSVRGCPICGDTLDVMEKDQNCRGCGSRARIRALHAVVQALGAELGQGPTQLPLLGFAMTGDERQVLRQVFTAFKSVSLFGNYGPAHELGVDARDLSRYAADSFAGHFGSLIFDYFEEHPRALAEAFRVIAPGGVLLTHIAPYRLTPDLAPVRIDTHIQQRQGYFDYVPKDVSLPSIKVGRDWFVAEMLRAGFEVTLAQVEDVASGIVIDGGRSWVKVFEKSWREIRHFHGVAADPHQAGRWYLSSGDKPHECRVWCSDDDGLTWNEATSDGSGVALHASMDGMHQAVNRYTDLVVLPEAPLAPRAVGVVGNPVRSMVDEGPGYLLLTEAKAFSSGARPQVCLLLKSEPYRLIELFTVDRHMARATGFTYSRASRAAKNGRFFSYRDAFDVFSGGPRLLQWDVRFE